jgi:hypothetical protein
LPVERGQIAVKSLSHLPQNSGGFSRIQVDSGEFNQNENKKN